MGKSYESIEVRNKHADIGIELVELVRGSVQFCCHTNPGTRGVFSGDLLPCLLPLSQAWPLFFTHA